MSPAPNEARALAVDDPYAQGWGAMMDLVTQGHSWSGRERNVLFVNTGGRGLVNPASDSVSFANASFVSGLDARSDGRALGIVDWDDDGDLDVWLRNRTAPRLQLMENMRGQSRPSLQFELEGAACNRDAIGAVVSVALDQGRPMVRSVRAGDLFLSQGSKRVHFGLAEHERIQSVQVLWPGKREWENFAGVERGGAYRLVQGTGAAQARSRRAPVEGLSRGEMTGQVESFSARVRLPARLPLFPSFRYRDAALQPVTLPVGEASGPRLLLLWSSRCEQCQTELPRLAGARDRFEKAGIEVVGLCVDAMEEAEAAYERMEASQWPFAWGFVEREVLEKMGQFQEALFDRAVPLAVPMGWLIDGEGNVLALYRGRIEAQDVWDDVADLLKASDEEVHHRAPPFAGTWFTNPVPRAFVAEDLGRRFAERFPEEALPYFHLAFTASTGDKREALRRELGERHRVLAQRHAEGGRPQAAVTLFEKALRYTPESAALHHNYGILMARYREWDRARALLARALELDPQSEATRQALEMVEGAAASSP